MADYPFEPQGPYTRAVTCSGDAAQKWFDRGMGWTFGFHHEEGIKCFERALASDPSCAMAQWGIAYCNGPNYNFHAGNGYYILSEMDAIPYPSMQMAFDAVQKAAALAMSVTLEPVEKELIGALQLRCSWPQSPFASELLAAYSNAMRKIHARYPADADVSFLFADSLMVQRPWALWDLSSGDGVDVCPELMATLEAGLAQHPNHPGLCHLWVHTLEMAPQPGRALEVCDRLRTLCPDNPHLCHMPTHIDVLVGQYREGILSNQRAIEAGKKIVANGATGSGFFLGYICHDYHMCIYSAMLGGQYKIARDTALDMVVAHASHESLCTMPENQLLGHEGYVAVLLHVYIRFGKWEEILAYPLPEDADLYATTTATCHYARALAYGVAGRLEEAVTSQEAFEAALLNPALAERFIHNNKNVATLAVGSAMLRGELAYRRGAIAQASGGDGAADFTTAWAALREARPPSSLSLSIAPLSLFHPTCFVCWFSSCVCGAVFTLYAHI